MTSMAANSPMVYVAADLFTPVSRDRNTSVARALQNAGYRIFLPQDINAPVTPEGLNMRVVFDGCRQGLVDADLVLALADGAEVDTGVAWELGYAAARGISTLVVRSDLRRAEHRGVNIMVEFGATRMVYATGYRIRTAELIELIVTEVGQLFPIG